MSSAAVPIPLLEFQRTDRPARLVETRVSADTIIPVVPWLAKYDRRLTVDDYIASYLGFLDARRFQVSPPGSGSQLKAKITVNNREYDVSTRQRSWEAHCRHMGVPVFVSSVYATLDCDTPYFRFDTERRYALRVTADIRRLRESLAEDPYYQVRTTTVDIPLSTWCRLEKEWFMVDPQRWARDLDTEWRVAELPQHGYHTSFLCTEYWEMHPSRREFVFVRVSDTEPRRDSFRIVTCPTGRPYVYFGRYFCRLDLASHNIREVPELSRIDDPVRQLLRVHSEADACRSEFGRFLLLAFYGPDAVYNQLGDAGLHIDYDRFEGILVPLTVSCVDWVAHHSIFEIIKTMGLPIDLVMLAFERSQVVDWTSCRRDGMRVEDGIVGFSNQVYNFFRYDYRTGDIDDLPSRNVGGRFESQARPVPVRFVPTIGKEKVPVDFDDLAYRPYALLEY